MSQRPPPTTIRSTFFGESNLTLLLNVVSGVTSTQHFDRNSSQDRTMLFGAMSTVYNQHKGSAKPPTLKVLNKATLRTMHRQLAERATSVSGDRGANGGANGERSGGSGLLRDVDTSRRTMPTQFLDPPSLSPQTSNTAPSSASASALPHINTALAQLEAQRTSHDLPKATPIDFNESPPEDEVDNSDVLSRMEALTQERQREEAEHSKAPPPSSSSSSESQQSQSQQPSNTSTMEDITQALQSFQANASALDAQVEEETERVQRRTQQEHEVFRKAQHQPAATASSTPSSSTSSSTSTSSTSSSSNSSTTAVHGTSLNATDIPATGVCPTPLTSANLTVTTTTTTTEAPTSSSSASTDLVTTTRFQDDLQLHADLSSTVPLDRCAFQQALSLDREQAALDDRMVVHGADMRERLLITPRKNYVTRTHYLEVSSADRLRVLNSTETPFSFTVYFGSDEPGYRVVPVFDSHPMVEADDNVHFTDGDCDRHMTIDINEMLHCRGIRGIPTQEGLHHNHDAINESALPPTEYITLYNCPTSTRANVNTVYRNVIGLQTNYVQLYMDSSLLAQIPYILLEISQFNNVYDSTTNDVSKSFCKLFYDRSTAPSTDSNIHVFVPLNRERKMFVTPLATIDRLTFQVLVPCNDIWTKQTEMYRFTEIELSRLSSHNEIGFKFAPDSMDIEDLLALIFKEGDCIHIDPCIEVYDQAEYDTWLQNTGQKERTDFEEKRTAYAKELYKQRNATAECREALRREFIQSLQPFSAPTRSTQQEIQQLLGYLTRPQGHLVASYDSSSSTVFVKQDSLHHTAANTLATYALLYAVFYHTSNTTNISLTVWTREEEDVIMSTNI